MAHANPHDVAWGETRTREVTWTDPLPPLASLRAMPGIVFLQGMIDGTEFHFNPLGLVHGSVLCTLLDTAVGCAVHTTLDGGWGHTSIDLNVTYLRPVTRQTGMLSAVGTVTKTGRRVSFAGG
jgi:uncharacterized protein (TIGR00369 family)